MRSEILLVSTTPQTVAAGGVVPVGSVVRRYGPALTPTYNGVNATACGYYDVFVGMTIAPAAVGSVTAQVLINGVPYTGAQATVTASVADTPHSIVIPTCIRVFCNSTATISVSLDAAAEVTSYTLMVDKD